MGSSNQNLKELILSGFTFKAQKAWKGSVLSLEHYLTRVICLRDAAGRALHQWVCLHHFNTPGLAAMLKSNATPYLSHKLWQTSGEEDDEQPLSVFFRWLNFNRLKCKTSTTYTVENTPQDFTINSCHHSTSEMGFFIHDSTTGASKLLHIVQHSTRRKINSNLILRLLALHSLTFDILLVKWVFSKSLTCNNKKQLRWKSVSYCFHSILHLPRKSLNNQLLISVNHWIINCLKEIKAPHTSSYISNVSTGFCTLYLHETWQETKKLDSLKAYIIPSLNMRTIPDAKNSLTLEP